MVRLGALGGKLLVESGALHRLEPVHYGHPPASMGAGQSRDGLGWLGPAGVAVPDEAAGA